MTRTRFKVCRLNADTCPMIPAERRVLHEAGIDVVEVETLASRRMPEAAVEADALMVVSARLPAGIIRRLSRCRVISRMGTGVDKIDVAQATRQGIVVTNLPDFCTDEVADHTMALLLSVARHLKECEASMRRGRRPHDFACMHPLSAQTLGLVGFGRIGKAVARRAFGFGLRVLVCDPALTETESRRYGVTRTDLDRALRECDYLALACPLTSATRNMVGIRELKQMKSSAVLVNTGRGELVNEKELITALREGIIRYAALDVFGTINVFAADGFSTDHPLFTLRNVVLTPHVASNSREALHNVRVRGAEAIVEVLSGNRPQFPVNPEVFNASS